MSLEFELTRRHAAIAGGCLFGIWFYFAGIAVPQGQQLDELRSSLEAARRQERQVGELRKRLADIDRLTGGAAKGQSIETRVERVAREISVTPEIRKVGDGSITEANKVEVRLPNLYLKDLVGFLLKIEQFPVTIQVVKLEIRKQQNVATVSLVLSDLNL
ncbi:MAG: type II secretion system protein M [Candidatus Riflebacteria bacterium]|nr:type II secretion system protein M [Candidatus Riflebacteria bacterium]